MGLSGLGLPGPARALDACPGLGDPAGVFLVGEDGAVVRSAQGRVEKRAMGSAADACELWARVPEGERFHALTLAALMGCTRVE